MNSAYSRKQGSGEFPSLRSTPIQGFPAVLLSVLLTSYLAHAAAIDPASGDAKPFASTPADGYKLVWSDEFNGTRLDTEKWAYRTGSRMWSTQLAANVKVANGNLILELKKEHTKDTNYTAGGIISKQAFQYGYYEAKIKTPPGAGWHTSFWMMRFGSQGAARADAANLELDVIENDSVKPTSYGVNLHMWNPKPVKHIGHKNIQTPPLCDGFHVFGCEYTAQAVRYFCDGKPVQTIDISSLPHGEVNIWLTSIASSLGKTKAVDDSKLPATALFDYVRFFEKAK